MQFRTGGELVLKPVAHEPGEVGACKGEGLCGSEGFEKVLESVVKRRLPVAKEADKVPDFGLTLLLKGLAEVFDVAPKMPTEMDILGKELATIAAGADLMEMLRFL